jgi:hypothetical protein
MAMAFRKKEINIQKIYDRAVTNPAEGWFVRKNMNNINKKQRKLDNRNQ